MGKTYAMLEDAQRARAAGTDVVVGYVEAHDRPETAALLVGLEVVPPRRVAVGGTTLPEMDLEAVLARRARIVLVDELAHTNLPGSVHTKRYEDVRALLAAGADVWTTLNVQHIVSLHDQVAAIAGVHQRETVPDTVLREADEVVVVDLPPEELRARIEQGKVYPRQRVRAALEGFFREETLAALRELVLREMAQVVEGRRVRSAAQAGRLDSAPVADRLLILAAGRPGDERLVREGWRLARSLQCEAAVLHVQADGVAPALEELRATCEALSLPLRIERARPGRHGVGETVAAIAREGRITRLLAGGTRDRRLPWRGSTLQEIMDRLPWADFVVIGDPARWLQGGRRRA